MEQNMETLSSVNAPGDASFNAADRLAIINLFGAYAQSYDAGKTDEFLSVFTEKVELIYMSGNKVVAEGVAQVTQAMPGRVKAFQAAKMQRRHALTSYAFTSQTDNEASGRLYFQVFSITDGGAPSVAVTGYYGFTAVKKCNTWKFSRWIAHGDQSLD
jgi:SnoaL-like domain